ncbi:MULTISPECIES: magnesium transporter CorA family protein [unclassified Halomonas]|uniref:magnesium transporter CorA family protein n=1 Tax=unclassified Halomonas TaxID=2609666 RepID=UPI00209C9A51|nr:MULTISPECIES: magnesium transporter CorA family protein [unclassified Halomonas]MCP1312931.1 magnesium transporter CorA family protein [Halomonas sp. 707D7]MCP1326450.1 magnesium transporter CorA family protein [Halomonas sp. 707D4]
MIRSMLTTPDGQVRIGGAELFEQWQKDPQGHLWLDLQAEPQEVERGFLEGLKCHPLAIQDAHKERHPPKIEEFDNHTLIIYRGISSFDAELNYVPQQVSFFVGERFLVTLHPGEAMSIERLFNAQGQALLAQSPERVALRVMYISAGFYSDSLLEFETALSDLEDEFQDNGNDVLMRQLTLYRSRLVKMRRIFSYHKGITQELTAYDYEHLPRDQSETLHAINDVAERFERLYSLTQMYYDICGDLINGYISISSHQLNITMRVLTVITAIFVPLTFIAGIYGMNFENMPELGWRYGYFFVWALMLSIAGALIWYFRRKKWF